MYHASNIQYCCHIIISICRINTLTRCSYIIVCYIFHPLRPHSIHRTQSATQPDSYYSSPHAPALSPLMSRVSEEYPLPPPPPPIYEEDQTPVSMFCLQKPPGAKSSGFSCPGCQKKIHFPRHRPLFMRKIKRR